MTKKEFPTHPIELHKMFKKTGLYIIPPDPQFGSHDYIIKIHASKIKSKSDLENAFKKIEQVANSEGFELKLKTLRKNFSDFRFHGNYYEILFNVVK